MIVTLTVIVILLSLLTQCEWVRQVLGWPQHQVLKCTLAGSLQEDMACKQLECGNKDVPMAPLCPFLSPQLVPGLPAMAASEPRQCWVSQWCPCHPEATSEGVRWGCQPSKTICLSTRLHSATARKMQLLLAAINSPIILANDLTDFINPAHSRQLPLSTLTIIWNRIPVE